MKRKFLSLLLCMLLIFSLGLPAFAADESMEEELTRVTLAVKNTLSIDDSYTSFKGDVDDMGALRYWTLRWSNAGGDSIRVLATEAGKVMQYRTDSNSLPRPLSSSGFSPSFSHITAAEARAAAEKFLTVVLTDAESAVLTDSTNTAAVSLQGSDYSLSAQILLHGVPAPYTAQLQISAETGEVVSFYRSDCYDAYVNEVPSAMPAVSAAAAAETLSGTINLELQYVLSETGSGSAAVLRYVPITGDSYYVDAQTGKLVNLTQAWADARGNGSGDENGASMTAADSASPEAADKGTGLSDVEQAAIQKLKDVLPQETLDAAARKVTALGLGRYTLSRASYSVDWDTGDVTCTLSYTRALSYDELNNVTQDQYQEGTYQQVKTLLLDAKTGALLQGWSYRPWYMTTIATNRSELQSAADNFLALHYPDYTGSVALAGGEGGTFRYDRTENGYFYHGNYVSIEIDPSDGSVASFYDSWTDNLTFDSADGIISAEAAKAAYCGVYTASLSYIAHPVSVDVGIPIWQTYAACCSSVAYRYALGYTYETNGSAVLGVDAKTGEPVIQTQTVVPAYTDIGGSYAKTQIEALAAAGIRLGSGAAYQPYTQLTQKDMLVLLLNACGYGFDADHLDENTLDSLYSAAWSQGFLPRGSRDPEHAVTRLEMVKAILDASPYGPAAALKGIYVTSFSDADQIPANDLGYAAIAGALGIVHGSGDGRFDPQGFVSRQCAAIILYNYMCR